MEAKRIKPGQEYIFQTSQPAGRLETVIVTEVKGDVVYMNRPKGRDSTTAEFILEKPEPYREYIPPTKPKAERNYFCETCARRPKCDEKVLSYCEPNKHPLLRDSKKRAELDDNNKWIYLPRKHNKFLQYPYSYFKANQSIKDMCAGIKKEYGNRKNWFFSEADKKDRTRAEISDLLSLARHYESVLGFPVRDTMEAMLLYGNQSSSGRFSHWNRIDKCQYIFENEQEFKERFPSGQYRCGRCGGISTNPVACNSGKNMSKTEICNWKAYGLFGPMPPYIGYIIKNENATEMVAKTIFAPIEVEHLHKKKSIKSKA